jgi:hypothetical protein
MCVNVPKQELATLNIQLSGKHAAFVDEFKYLGTTIHNMSYRGTKMNHPPTLSQTTNDAMMRQVEALLGPRNTTLHAREYCVRVLRQLITEACSAAEFGSGVMVHAPWAALETRLKELVSRDPSGASLLRSCWESWVSCRSMRVRPCTRCGSGMTSWHDRLPRCRASRG